MFIPGLGADICGNAPAFSSTFLRPLLTASISLLPEITRKVRPPRALEVPYSLGFPLGRPNDPPLQRRILRALLRLTSRGDVPLVEKLGDPAGD